MALATEIELTQFKYERTLYGYRCTFMAAARNTQAVLFIAAPKLTWLDPTLCVVCSPRANINSIAIYKDALRALRLPAAIVKIVRSSYRNWPELEATKQQKGNR